MKIKKPVKFLPLTDTVEFIAAEEADKQNIVNMIKTKHIIMRRVS